jgi:hypothetical protein
MAKKKAAVKKGSRKSAEIKPPERTLATRSGCLEQDSPAYVLFSDYTIKKRKEGDVVVKFRATAVNADISSFVFEVIYRGHFPNRYACVSVDYPISAEIRCVFYGLAKDDHDGSGVGGPEDELIVTVMARKVLTPPSP